MKHPKILCGISQESRDTGCPGQLYSYLQKKKKKEKKKKKKKKESRKQEIFPYCLLQVLK